LTRAVRTVKVEKSAGLWGGVAEFVFQGGAGLFLDGKGRMTVPARNREVLKAVAQDKLTITKHPKRCLLVFPRPAWEQFRAKLLLLPMSAEDWRRVFIGSAMDVDIDAASRVLVAPELRQWAGMERDVLLLGMGSRFELWDKVRHDAHEATVLAAGMPDVLRDHVM
jgi:MraZ protein